ncbi:hypothetical protein MKZ08_13010 [Viridibacillus sp. FSL R5-0477]|uniref:Uncharacterized protein n=1 Tax=Viridibacillus arenosi FSL R5-213 TaxID=1227360 RepID=W4EIZ9_9BACL|nr:MULTISPECIES: hypothetical protein [Viridibacillus]ETT80578.1 hypothetical protein C176_21411 [Viridibacillus arenosi FSL R5-213]OMC77748.1 hypothetical protein BK130_21125 [Viridibacillus sp. FSL H8-0123]OMC82284.1 hypothetical protein BK128_20770 [Viridibacillus sp. FSL H7-0596]OMC87079.1 hypothetical protein BK137_20960 [Viridibacillus arenosi]
MKNLFMQRLLVSILLMVFGFIQVILDTSAGFNNGYITVLLGGIILLFSTISNITSRKNKSLEKELAKEYDERDALIDGKVARFSLYILISEILILMFLTNFVEIPANTALFIVLISLMIIEFGSRKYYTHVL